MAVLASWKHTLFYIFRCYTLPRFWSLSWRWRLFLGFNDTGNGHSGLQSTNYNVPYLSWVCISCLFAVYLLWAINILPHSSKFGGKPHTWDQSQKGSVNNEEIDDDDNWKGAILFMGSSVKFDTFTRLSWAEYVFVSLSLALVIA